MSGKLIKGTKTPDASVGAGVTTVSAEALAKAEFIFFIVRVGCTASLLRSGKGQIDCRVCF